MICSPTKWLVEEALVVGGLHDQNGRRRLAAAAINRLRRDSAFPDRASLDVKRLSFEDTAAPRASSDEALASGCLNVHVGHPAAGVLLAIVCGARPARLAP